MLKFIVPLLLFNFCLFLSSGLNGQDKISDAVYIFTDSGWVRGFTDEMKNVTFLGIPYAMSTAGAQRWKDPLPRNKWTDTLNATEYGASCPQPRTDNGVTSEDCLNLNIFSTQSAINNSATKLPVMVWLHGGGFYHGSARGYDGEILARKGVVVVTINYRLGPLGYLAHPVLQASSTSHTSGNYGLLDQVAALKWIKNNIQSFGGDPGNVTIWGESAGAFSVGALLCTPSANGLFHKAILESGTGLINGIQSKNDAYQYANNSLQKKGIKDTGKILLNILYSLTPGQLDEIFTPLKRPPLQGFYVWLSPVVDGSTIPLLLDKALLTNSWNKVPILLGSNLDEGAYFQRKSPTTDTLEYYELLGNKSLGDNANLLRGMYPVKDTGEIFEQSQHVVGDFGFNAPARALARMATSRGAKVWLYHFTRISKNKDGKIMKALHSTELPFVFGHTTEDWVPYVALNGLDKKDSQYAEAMSAYWTNFAKYGDPNGIDKNKKWPLWPLFKRSNNAYLEIGDEIKPKINLRKKQLDVMDKFSKQKGECRN